MPPESIKNPRATQRLPTGYPRGPHQSNPGATPEQHHTSALAARSPQAGCRPGDAGASKASGASSAVDCRCGRRSGREPLRHWRRNGARPNQGCSKVRPIAARVAPAALKSEGRKPKSEGNPKPEIREGLQPLTRPAASEAGFSGLRILDFFRISVFGIRIWAGCDRL
jgi:hypothetical protein